MTEDNVFNQWTPKGEFQDTLIDLNHEVIWQRPWQSNLIVNGLRTLLAGLVKGDDSASRLNVWAVGIGATDWADGTRPPDTERRTRAELYREVGRKLLDPSQITFPDRALNNQIEIRANFLITDLLEGEENRRLREFGLFANGSADTNTGILINHHIHSPIDMERGFTLQRILRLTF